MENTITILLIGETGVGKSTFINSFVNYLLFDSMEDAVKDLKCLIPTQFTVFDKKDRKLKEVLFGKPDQENEGTDSTQSCTKHCKCYTFRFVGFTLKIIDTPGIGDTSGVIKDNINMRNLLAFISQYKEINAICVLLKPNNARVGVVFKYCILQILANLNKSASDNIVFVFTNARGTFYEPGDTAPALIKILDAVKSRPPYVEIKFNENTTYCLDNEAFRYLVAVSEPNNLEFDKKFYNDFEESWRKSVAECERLLSYIKSLKPHSVKDTITVNNIRQKIILLQKPIGDIAKNISDEITECEKRRVKIHEFVGDIQELKKELYIPALDIVSTPLNEPITVCTDPNCREEKVINGEKKYHYKSICHKPCYLSHRDGNIIGNTGLLDCEAFNKYRFIGGFGWYNPQDIYPDMKFTVNELTGKVWAGPSYRTISETCFKCGHTFRAHLHSTYETKIIHKEIRDEVKFERITTNEELVQTQQNMIQTIEGKICSLKNESKIIADISAEFACFLKKHALTPYNDALEDYIKYLINNQNSEVLIESETNETVETLQLMLEQYQREKRLIMNAINREDTNYEISSEKINEKFTELFNLNNYGKVIESHFQMQKESEALFHSHSQEKEFVIKPGMGSALFGKLINITKYFK